MQLRQIASNMTQLDLANGTSVLFSYKTPVAKVTTTTFQGGKVVSKKSEFTRPSTARLITWERYQKDISTRWAIHQFEIQELIKDLTKAVDFFQPYHTELVKRVKAINF